MRLLIPSFLLVGTAIGGAIAQTPNQAPPRHGAFPKVSPDGRFVLFQRDSGGRAWSYVMNADGSNQRVVPGSFVATSWFPDSRRLFVTLPGETRTAPVRVASVNIDGTDLKELPTGSTSITRGAQLVGDGKTVLFAAPSRDSAGRPTVVLNLLDLGVERARRLAMPALPGRIVGAPAVSHDGRRLAFVIADTTDPTSFARSSTLYVMEIDGDRPLDVATLPNLIEQAAWSHDGRMVALQHSGRTPPIGTPMPANHVADANLVVIEIATGVIRPITHRDRRYLDEVPSWSPNGYIYFQSDRDGRMEIYRMKLDGSQQEPITGVSRSK